MGRSPVFYDYSRQRVVKTKDNTRGVCTSCGKDQMVARVAWIRKTRPLCRHCGALLEPSPTAQRKFLLGTRVGQVKEVTRCACGTILRSNNKVGECAVCECKRLLAGQ